MPQNINYIHNKKDLFHIFIYVPAGAIYEDENQLGISHLLEHMLFKHTKKYSERELLKEMTALGGSYNAITDRDTTFYYIMTHMDNYKKAVDIIYEITRRPVFTKKELDVERKVVFEEISSRNDNNSKFFNISYLTVLDINNKYSRAVEGKSKTLKQIKVSNLEKYFDTLYNNVDITINCDVKHKKHVEQYVTSKFGESRPLSFSKLKESYEIYKNSFKSNIIVIQDPSLQFTTHVLFPSFPREMTKENAILNLIRYCLASSGLYSLLTYELRSKQGLVYSVNSMCESYRYLGIFRLMVSSTSEDTAQIVSLILTTLQTLKKSGISKEQFKFFKKVFLNQQKYALTSDDFRTILHSELSFYGANIDDTEYLKLIEEISLDDIIDVSNKVFLMDKIGIITSGPYRSTRKVRKVLNHVVQNTAISLNKKYYITLNHED